MISELFGSLPCNGEIRTAERLGNIAAWCILLYRQMRRVRACTRAQPVAANAVHIEYITSSSSPSLLFCIDFFFFLFCQISSSSIKYKRRRRNLLRIDIGYTTADVYIYFIYLLLYNDGRSYPSYPIYKIGLFRIVAF